MLLLILYLIRLFKNFFGMRCERHQHEMIMISIFFRRYCTELFIGEMYNRVQSASQDQ